MAKYDWQALTLAFVSQNGSLEEFAEKEKIPLSTINKKSAELGWLEKRKFFGSKTEVLSTEHLADERARLLVEQNRRDVHMARLGAEKLVEFLPLCEKASDLKAWSGALKDVQAVARLALGASTENTDSRAVDDFEAWLNERVEQG